MSDQIYFDRDNMERRMGDVVDRVDELDAALADIPSATDAGAVSALIGFIAAAGAEAANEYAGAVRLIGAITVDVAQDITATEEEVTDVISDLESELED
jgi:chromosome condensin MukBEF ATPase and DNA-binding subunit MukB